MQGALGRIIHAVLDAPVHDVANEGAGEKTQQLHDSEDGGVELNWAGAEAESGCQRRDRMLQQPPSDPPVRMNPAQGMGRGQGPAFISLPVSSTFCLCSFCSVGRGKTW